MKQEQDKFTRDAFETPRRGRPPVLQPLTNAQRQARYRKAVKQGTSDPVAQAKIQAAFLRSTAKKLQAMSADWGDIDEHFLSQLQSLGEALTDFESELGDYIAQDGFSD
ncbi:hypothetical protein UNDYM_2583 [Undibacterium sp. YM2]|uniref:hypothetical protein n=1 Tax=Undibacterium sp. YM2 TaxID=2058625 RepID=UPI001331C80B|nr:hypothetical protein [Undibacterium sp. YM2]BBB66836.1 hypothetical protein UNDYM_2583 [Undibacterium sp. YM2]